MTEPIASYALLSDCQGAALVSLAGSIDWACMSRFDAPSVFTRLLDDDAGYFSIHPTRPYSSTRRYLDDTMVLRTVHQTESGTVAVTDAMVLSSAVDGHSIGRSVPHQLIRVVESLEGEVELDIEIVPRPEYGMTVPRLAPVDGGFRTIGGPEMLVVSSSIALQIEPGRARGRFTLRSGERVHLAVQTCSPWQDPVDRCTPVELDRRLDDTLAMWRSWSALHQNYRGAYRDLVNHSGRVLQALTYAPTGAIIAAATTSLPETPGGERNWDYRYCWVRDASLTMQALWVAACPDEAGRFFDFIATAAGTEVTASGCGSLQILYGVGGERRLDEHTLGHLDGYGGARPVRVGNGAWDQTQLDVYGELLNAAFTLSDQLGPLTAVTRELLREAADTAASRWREPDQGIWEVRGGPRHFLYSKLMCWVALDRAVQLAEQLEATDRVAGWMQSRDDVRRDILENGWNPAVDSFTQSYGSTALDASALMIPIVGFLPADDPRVRSTVDAVAAGLTDSEGFVYRYRAEDGLEGGEGTFVICSFWLVECLAMLGQTSRARELFERLTSYANDIGLLAEELDPDTGGQLGNFPQAFTHIGLVNAAWAITQAERSAGLPGV